MLWGRKRDRQIIIPDLQPSPPLDTSNVSTSPGNPDGLLSLQRLDMHDTRFVVHSDPKTRELTALGPWLHVDVADVGFVGQQVEVPLFRVFVHACDVVGRD